jgi:hypothetical protein
MGCALKVKNLNLNELYRNASPKADVLGRTKSCSGCDPDMPGHVDPAVCPKCRGTRREPTSFVLVATELDESRREAAVQSKTRGRGRGAQMMDTEDADLYLEY